MRIVNLSGEYMNTRNIAAVELPAKLFGKTEFKPGDTIEFDSTFFTQAGRIALSGRASLPCASESAREFSAFRLDSDGGFEAR